MKFVLAGSCMVALLTAAGPLPAAETANALRQTRDGVVFNYGVVPAERVLAHPDQHPERTMHGGVAPKGSSHLVVALSDAVNERRITEAEVTARVTLLGGTSVTKRLEPMAIANQQSFGGFFQLSVPGIYRIRFEVRRPGIADLAAAEFEHRVLPEGRRR
ncbi:MAG: hypothetical protein ABI654_10475 [Betaproteobacteria bacterium]